jgi:toxin FitB
LISSLAAWANCFALRTWVEPMFVLDTNVISELRKAQAGTANTKVVKWAKGAATSALFISVVTVLEIEVGVLQMERRDKKQGAVLRRWMTQQILPAFEGRVLDVNTAVAQRCVSLHVPNPQADRDALIAATALVHGMTVVTRNTADFLATGVKLLNPWA